MKSSMTKTTLREIRQSMGRYFAIMAIVALGVGLFSGLKVTRTAMVQSAQEYFDSTQLYDIRLLSTVGFDTDTAKEFSRKERIVDAEGAVETDALLINSNGKEGAYKVHSITQNQNIPVVDYGRLPQSPSECVVDSLAFGKNAVGTTLTVSSNNDDNVEDMFVEKTLRVVGVVHSSYYTNYERGTTSLGNGMIQGFVMVNRDAFDCDYDTEIFLKVNTQGAPIYTEEYDKQIEEVKDWLEDAAQEKADERYNRLRAEGKDSLYEADQSLIQQTSKAEVQLIQSKQQLDSAKGQIEGGKAEAFLGEQQLASGKAQLLSQERELLQQQNELILKKQQVLSGLDQLSGLKAIPSQAAMAAQKEQELKMALTQIENGLFQIQAGLDTIAMKKDELLLKETELKDSQMTLEQAQQEYQAGLQAYEEGKTQLSVQGSQGREQINEAQKTIHDMKSPDVYVLGRDTNIGYVSFESDSSIVDGIADVFPIFFFLVAALVCVTTMNRMVEEQRTQIGVLKALGYSEKSIMGKYLFYSGSAAGLGCVLGFFGGSVIFPLVIWQAYGMMYTLGDITIVLDPVLAVISFGAAMLCSMGATYFSCRHELASVPAQLMRPKAPQSGKRILLERLPFLWNRLSFLVKVSIRNVLRYKKRFFMMVIGIGGCTALLVTGFGIKDSIADIAGQQFGEVQTYGMSAMLNDNYTLSQWETIEDYLKEETTSFARVSESSMDVELADGKEKSITLVIPQDTARIDDYWNLTDKEGNTIPYPKDGEAVINREFARRHGIALGDKITIHNEDGNELTLKVTGLNENYVYNYLYITPGSWESQTGEEVDYRGLYIKGSKNLEEHVLLARLMNMEGISSVTVNGDILDRFNSMMGSLDYIVILIIICAGSLAFIVLYNLTNINITERIREIATIKVLGFFPKETAAYVFRENIFLTAIGSVTGLLLGKALHWFVMDQINIDMVSFARIILPMSYVYSIVLTFVFACIVNMVMFAKLEKINMAESLKSIE